MTPALETERLRLRMWREDDFEDYAAMCADPEVMRYLGDGKTMSRMDAWRQMAVLAGHWQLRGYGHWAVEEKASGRMIGRTGFLYPEGWPDFEIGWTFGRSWWGRGYATEAARAALAHAFHVMGRDHVISLIRPGNLPSIRVAERLGERFQRKIDDFLGGETLVYGIDRATWSASA